MWHVYLLYNPDTNRTYIGATTNPKRRLRQHNREIKGGARATLKGAGSWRLVCTLSQFPDKVHAYRWEKLLKLRGGKGLNKRLAAFLIVGEGKCPVTRRYKIKYKVPEGIVYAAY